MTGQVRDVGPGAGTYARLLDQVPGMGTFTAVGIFAPYVQTYKLLDLYDVVEVCDIRDYDWPGMWDFLILSDVLEHLPKADGIQVWTTARHHARKAVITSLPIYGYEQGTLEGNVHETHLHQWDHHQVLYELSGITDFWRGQIVGVYVAEAL
jgi:hypothetical protein